MKKKLTRIPVKNSQTPFYISQGIPFIKTQTSSTEVLTPDLDGCNFTYSYAENRISGKTLQFLMKVRKHALTVPALKKTYLPEKIQYNKVLNTALGHYTGFTELDINAAYWSAAYKLGFISESIYEEGLTRPKIDKLIALGALATVKKIWEYDGKPGSEVKLIQEKTVDEAGKLRNFYFCISSHISELILNCIDCIGRENFFLFWTDAVFVKRTAASSARAFFARHGYGLKEKEILHIQVKETPEKGRFAFCTMTEKDDNGDHKTKYFCIPYKRAGESRTEEIKKTL